MSLEETYAVFNEYFAGYAFISGLTAAVIVCLAFAIGGFLGNVIGELLVKLRNRKR